MKTLLPLPLLLGLLCSACTEESANIEDTVMPDADQGGHEITQEDASESEDVAPDGGEGTDVSSSLDPSLSLPVDERGPFNVGYRTFPTTYSPAGLGGERTIDLHIWYPTRDIDGPTPAYEGFFLDEDSLTDATFAEPLAAEGYPVHVYSHGHLGFAGSTAAMMRYFASHGWVAVAPDHTLNTISDNVDPRPTSMYLWRSLDISAALDHLAALPEDEPLSQARTEQVVMSGHSFGVHTCWATAGATFDLTSIEAECASGSLSEDGCTEAEKAAFAAGVRDVRVVATIPMAGSIKRELFGESGHESVAIPVLAMSGSEDPVGAEAQFESMPDVDLTWIDLAGGCHQTFGIGGCDTLDTERGFAIINTYALAFARRHVLGDEAPRTLGILDGSEPVDDEAVTLKRHLAD